MLKSIEWRNNIAGTVENRYDFLYYDDSTQTEDTAGYNPNYHYGAIKRIRDYHGTITEYSYTQIEEADYDSGSYTGNPKHNSEYVKNNAYLRINRNILKDNAPGPADLIHGDDGILVHGGTYDNGKEYMLIQGGLKKDRLWLYTFNGHEWILDSIIKCKHYYRMLTVNGVFHPHSA